MRSKAALFTAWIVGFVFIYLLWLGQVPAAEWTLGTETAKFQGQLEAYLAKFQDPAQSDAMSRMQADLDDTKIILVMLDR